MDQKIIERAKLWGQNSYFSDEDRLEVSRLLENIPQNEQELTERFHQDLEFGTGGLRAPMGMGQNRMNKYNVRRATQAMANNIKKHFGAGSSAVIAYDSRHRSREFALEAAGVFAANGIKAHVFPEITPTPMLSFGVRYHGAQAGIMVTASHNPPIYNGYKAFWNDGAQVVPPVDKEIIAAYNQLTDWNAIRHMDFEEARQQGLACWVEEQVNEAFYQVIEKEVIQDPELCRQHGKELAVVFTALHGTSQIPCTTIAARLGFSNWHSIKEQAIPDGNFSTVKSPNPEDPKAMAMATEYMLKNNADIAYGSDPDGDRLGVVINDNGQAVYLNGNQIGALMLYYIFSVKLSKQTLPKHPLVLKSIVTSPIQNAIVEHFGGEVEDTLTGFKWMAARIREHEEQKTGKDFLFASEESFGYMPHCRSRDKDGISSVALMSELALYFKRQGKNLNQALDEIYEKFGFYMESLVSLDYEGIEGSKKIQRIMQFFRQYPASEFAGEEIVAKEDYDSSQSYDLKLKSNKIITLPKSNVLSFTLASGNRLFLRPSGTEPKIKFYTMVRVTEGELAHKKINALKRIHQIEEQIKEICERT
jgi:phosphoglucomutase